MRNINDAVSGTRRRRVFQLLGGFTLCLLVSIAQADTVSVGVLSYDTFIPAGDGSPGVLAFDLANLTGAFSLPTDLPVTNSLTFESATLTLTLSDLTQDVIALGDIGPGFLLDQSGNPIVQVPGNEMFDSAEFTATLSPLTFSLYDGTQFTADSTLIDAILLPSIGPTLTVDVDQSTISVTGTVQATVPEPASDNLILPPLLGLAWWRLRPKRGRAAKGHFRAEVRN